MTQDANVLRQIGLFLCAKAEHDIAFNDVGAEADDACSEALERMDEAFLGVCVSRPLSEVSRYFRDAFVREYLFDFTVSRPMFRKNVFDALEADSPVDKSNNGENGQ